MEEKLERPGINDDVIHAMIVNDLQQYHGYTKEDAEDSDFGETVVSAMWDEYSYVLSECSQGRM